MADHRHPQHDRALQLFQQGHDIDAAWLIAASEARDRQQQRNDADEPRGRVWTPRNGTPHTPA